VAASIVAAEASGVEVEASEVAAVVGAVGEAVVAGKRRES
jgi:hypothetical protein